ncbi:MAG: beta-N-acetylhexosaminidase [Firmicutes bacterium]|nr:beta-N-acetylhexosaminidase [Bacillota bacterium]
MQLIPKVKKIQEMEGSFTIPKILKIFLPQELSNLEEVIEMFFVYETTSQVSATLRFTFNETMKDEGYHLVVQEERIEIEYIDYHGALYGLMTFFQLVKSNRVTCFDIVDFPDLKIRGFMLDISRDKIPTLETLKHLINLMMQIKMNHFELYIEGFSYEFPSFPGLPVDTPFLVSEFQELSKYAFIRGVDVVPNMNGLGHMTKWLNLKEYHSLSECEDGFLQYGFMFPASTLNPLDPKSIELVKKMYLDILPYSNSNYFHMNCDEPFELSKGKSQQECEKLGVGTVYMNYVSKLSSFVKEFGKTPFIWGDVILHHEEILVNFPESLIVVDWGYDFNYPFNLNAKLLQENRIPFILAPGTSSWNSFSSRLYDMKETTKNAALASKTFGGLGVITTDWGDFGHLQNLIFSYPGLIYAGVVSWGDDFESFDEIKVFMNEIIFNNTKDNVAQIIFDLASYSNLENEYLPNQTMTFKSIMYADPDSSHPLELKKYILKEALKTSIIKEDNKKMILTLIQKAKNAILDTSSEVKEEILQTIRLIQLSLDINQKINSNTLFDSRDLSLINQIIETHELLWLKRNKPGGLDRSLSRLFVIKALITDMNNQKL